jgi:hypothetical protein
MDTWIESYLILLYHLRRLFSFELYERIYLIFFSRGLFIDLMMEQYAPLKRRFTSARLHGAFPRMFSSTHLLKFEGLESVVA